MSQFSGLYHDEKIDLKIWYYKGKVHKEDGPAIISDGGARQMWYLWGRLNREGGPAVEYANGTCEWWFEGRPHRIGGPAIIRSNGSWEWHIHGIMHRIDGPAMQNSDGNLSWWWMDNCLSFDEWQALNKKLSDEEKLMLKLQYG